MKKTFYKKYCAAFVFCLIFFIAHLSAQETQHIESALPGFHEYTLQNGMQVYMLEDVSSVPIRIEYTARAGYSAQTPKTAGFFQLYASLFTTAGKTAYMLQNAGNAPQNWLLDSLQAYCSSDSARYEITVTPSQIEQTLQQLSYCIQTPLFTDTDLQREFQNLKTSVMQNAFSTAGFINSSIDARVYASAPWKQESGIYPSLFSNTTLEETRSILTNIERNYYTPKNSALFISGAINAPHILSLLNKYFTMTALPSLGAPSDDSDTAIKPSKQRKFVLHDRLFTNEMSQIVVQYTGLSLMQTNVAAATFNNRNSTIKTQLSNIKELAIRDQEYINIAAAHKNGNSRLIIQSLLEKSKTNPAEQADRFVTQLREAANISTAQEYESAKQRLISEYRTRFKSSSVFMDMLSQFWAVGTAQNSEQTIIQQLLAEPQLVQNEEIAQLTTTYNAQEPFVFVLVNTDIYNTYAKAFKKAGYEVVTTKNGSWYSQKLYEVLTNSKHTPTEQTQSFIPFSASDFAETNAKQFSTTVLANGIPVIFKRNPTSTTVVISLTIAGGNLISANTTPGLEEIIINALADNIHDGITSAQAEGVITGIPEVNAQTNSLQGTITVECLPQDVSACLTCISQAIIYGTIKASSADGLLFNKQSTHRVEMGDPVYQLYSAAIRQLYHDTPYPALFDAQHDILNGTTYLSILAAYPSLLDAQRYSLILTGNIPEDDYKTLLEEQLGILKKQKELSSLFGETKKTQSATPTYPVKPDFANVSSQKVAIEHRFFTDVTADKAGPRPEVLVPTTEFLDPVQYWFPSPTPDEAAFEQCNALLYAIQHLLQAKHYTIHFIPASYEIQAATLTFVQVRHTKEVDTAFATTVQEIASLLENTETQEGLVQFIKDTWILQKLSQTQTNRGTTLLIQDSINKAQNPIHYLKEYQTIDESTAQDFLEVLQQWIPQEAPFRLYSKDAKK